MQLQPLKYSSVRILVEQQWQRWTSSSSGRSISVELSAAPAPPSPSTPSSIAALPAIVDAVGDDLTVLMDGGIRSGLDVLKALARGAKACLIGRAWAYALGAAGEAGVSGMLATLRQELRLAMSLTGCLDVREAGRDLLTG